MLLDLGLHEGINSTKLPMHMIIQKGIKSGNFPLATPRCRNALYWQNENFKKADDAIPRYLYSRECLERLHRNCKKSAQLVDNQTIRAVHPDKVNPTIIQGLQQNP